MKKLILFLACLWSLSALSQQELEICGGGHDVTYTVGMDIPGTVEWFLDGQSVGGGLSTTITYSHTGDYQLVAIGYNQLGCPGTPVVYHIAVTQCDPLLYWVANTFTPDGDEYNHDWGPVLTSGISLEDFSLTVYNRWGETIWTTYDSSAHWDGTFSGMPVPNGSYIWSMRLKMLDTDEVKNIAGHVNVLR